MLNASRRHRRQLNRAAARVALAASAVKAGLTGGTPRRCLSVREADAEMKGQATVAVCERTLAGQELTDFGRGMSLRDPGHRSASLVYRSPSEVEERQRTAVRDLDAIHPSI